MCARLCVKERESEGKDGREKSLSDKPQEREGGREEKKGLKVT